MTTYRRPHAPTQPPQHPMPSRRVSVTNQIRLLIAAAALGGPRLKAFSIHDAAKHTGIAIGQVRYSTRFLVEAGLLDTIGNGVYAPSQAGRDFGTLWESSRDRARAVLAGCFSSMWFMATLQRDLASGPVPAEKLEAALLADGGGHQQHIKLLRSLIEWLTVAMLIEQQPDGMIGRGPLLTVEGIAADEGGQSDLPDSNGELPTVEDDEEESRMTAQPNDLERGATSVPEARSDSVMTSLAVEALQRLSPDQIPDFMRALAVLAQGSPESILHRC